jgi:hypothetical protein
MGAKAWLAIGLVVVALAAWWLEVGRRQEPRPDLQLRAPDGVPSLPGGLALGAGPIVAWSAHTAARFEPCGCTAGMYGGLVRRAGLLARAPAERLLSLELGGWSAGAQDFQVINSDFYLRGLHQAGIDAVGIGAAEVALGAALLGRLARESSARSLPLLAANVRGAPLVPSLRLTVAGRALLVTAVVARDAVGDGLTVLDPVDSLLPLVAGADGAAVVVMADLDEAGLAALARALPGVALIVGGAVESPTASPLGIGAVRVVHAANHGKTIGWWPWGGERCHFDLIDDSLPDDPRQRALVGEYQQVLGTSDLAVDHIAAGGAYVGDAACTTCHAAAAQVHGASRHAHALASLERKGYHRDPQCLRCHVTAFAQPGGYTRQRPADWRATVSCEACHGPGRAHVAAGGIASPLRPVGAATCVRCHDAENSPRFDFAEYWGRIVHHR